MSNKLLAVTLILLLAVIAVVIYTKDNEIEQNTPDIAISFICENDQHFTAEFDLDFETLRVVESGEFVRELPRVDEELMIFSNDDFDYTFAGEGVRVLNKISGEETTCQQPFDPNNAPYNFGDLGEGAGEDQNILLAVEENILGTWVSVDDEKFEREFQAGGIVVDTYEGEETSTGPFTIFDSETGVATEFPQTPDTIYLSIESDTEDALYFSLTKLTPEELELIYLNRGGVLRFTRAE